MRHLENTMENGIASNGVHHGAHHRSFAAIFLDFENVYYFLKNEFADPPELNDHVLEILRNLRTHLEDNWELDSIILNAYADFERIGPGAGPGAQGALYLLGVNTKNVLGTEHKNAADMGLCIDVLEILYTRREIDTFVLVAGDRDYIPVIQHLRRQAKRVLGVGFRESVSGDLLLNLGDKKFIDARDLLDPATLERLEDRRRDFQQRQAEREARFADAARARDEKALQAMRAAAAEAHGNGEAAGGEGATGHPDGEPHQDSQDGGPEGHSLDANGATAGGEAGEGVLLEGAEHNGHYPHGAHEGEHGAVLTDTQFDTAQRIEDEDALRCLDLILQKLRQLQKTRYTNEIWLGPFLRHLTDEMPALADFERRMLLDILSRSGAIRIEKREGEPYPYSIVLVNYAHPDVWDLNP
jgi:uncharacterized LabA/DUF88 family protein